MARSILNTELLALAALGAGDFSKASFVDQAMAAGGGAPPDPAMDPAMAGGMPMDPSMAGGAPPPAPGVTPEDAAAIAQQVVQASGGGAAGGAGGEGGAGGAKPPKVDVGQELYQIKKMLAQLFGTLGLNVPADLLLREQDAGGGAGDASASGPAPTSAIQPIEPLAGASPQLASGGGEKSAEADRAIHRGRSASIPRTTVAGPWTVSKRASALLSVLNAAKRR